MRLNSGIRLDYVSSTYTPSRIRIAFVVTGKDCPMQTPEDRRLTDPHALRMGLSWNVCGRQTRLEET